MFRQQTVALGFTFSLIATLAATQAFAQQPTGRAFGIDDALNARCVHRTSATSPPMAAGSRSRSRRRAMRSASTTPATAIRHTSRQRAFAEFQLVDATTGQSRTIVPGKVQVRGATFTKDGKQLAFFMQKGDDWSINVYDAAAAKMKTWSHSTRASRSRRTRRSSGRPTARAALVTLRPDGWNAAAHAAFLHITEGPIVVQDAKDPFLSWDAVRNMSDRQIPAIVTAGRRCSARDPPRETPITRAELLAATDRTSSTPRARPRRPRTTTPARSSLSSSSSLAANSNAGHTRSSFVERRLTLHAGIAPATAFAYDDRGNVMVRTLGTDSARNLTAKYRRPAVRGDSTSRASYTVVDWRPDLGAALLVSAKDGWYLLDVASDSLSMIYPFEADTATRPARAARSPWSSDGRSIFLTRSAQDRWARGLERYDVTAQHSTALAQDASLYASWARRGRTARASYSSAPTANGPPNSSPPAPISRTPHVLTCSLNSAACGRGPRPHGAHSLSRRRREEIVGRALLSHEL